MITLKFYGPIKKHYHRLDFDVAKPVQALRLLMAQNHAFKRELLNNKFQFRIDGQPIDSEERLAKLDTEYPDGTVLQVYEVVQGRLAGLASIGLATWITIGVAAVSIAFSLYMAKNMKLKTSAESAQDNTIDNNTYTSTENRVGQGKPVPILLGEMVVGSNVISLGIDTSNNADWHESIS